MEVSIVNTEKIVKHNHPDWEYKRIQGTAFYLRVGEMMDRALMLGVRLEGRAKCWLN